MTKPPLLVDPWLAVGLYGSEKTGERQRSCPDVASSAMRTYTIFSTGTWTSAAIDGWAGYSSTQTTSLSWINAKVSFASQPSADTVLQIQFFLLAVSLPLMFLATVIREVVLEVAEPVTQSRADRLPGPR